MFVPFESLPTHSRVWIFQADKKFTNEVKRILDDRLLAFTHQWSVHGEPMQTSYHVFYDQFVVLAANDQASGCSIDSSVRVIKELGEATNINFFDRTSIAFLKKGQVVTIPMKALKEAFERGDWNEGTLTFNNLVNQKGLLENQWILPAANTWLKRYLPHETISN